MGRNMNDYNCKGKENIEAKELIGHTCAQGRYGQEFRFRHLTEFWTLYGVVTKAQSM